MSSAPVYVSRFDSAGLGQVREFGPLEQPRTEGAIARFGAALSGVAQVATQADGIFKQINRATTLANRTTGFLQGVDQLEQEFQNDPDSGTVPQRFGDRVEEMKRRATDGLNPEDQAELNLKLTREGISSVGRVRQQSLRRQADQFGADMDVQFDAAQRRYVAAGSDVERKAVADEWSRTLMAGVERGVMTAQRATAYQQTLGRTGDEALILRAIATSPQRALAALDDPAQFAGFDATTRERYRAQARAAAEEAQAQRLEQQARWSPLSAVATVGRLNSPDQVGAIVDRAIIPQESGGNPNAISPKGAQGIGQIMPRTARALGPRVGRPDLADMPAPQLEETLRADPALNRRLAIAHIDEGLRMTDGSLFAAIAGYHGGNPWAAGVHRQAVERFGPTYTAEQFASLIPDGKHDGTADKPGKKTSEYLLDVVRRLGGDPAAGGGWRAQARVNGVLQEQQAALSRQESQMIAIGQQGVGDSIAAFNQGYAANPAVVAQQRAALNLGAMRGDASAMQRLRELDEAEAAAPVIREAYGMAPESLALGVSQMRQQMAAGEVSPTMMRRLRLFEGVQQEVARGRAEDSVGLAVRAGIVPATALPAPAEAMGQGDPAAFAQAVGRRSAAFDVARRAYGGEGHFFRPDERAAFKAAFDQADDAGKAAMLKGLAAGASPEAYARAVTQIAGDNPVMQLVGRMARTDERTASDILRGTTLLASKGVPDPKVAELREALKGRVAGDLFPGEHQGAVVDAALAIYAAERGRNWQLYDRDDRAGLERALERAAGGVIARINGAPAVLPRGVTETQFRQAVQLVAPADLGGSAVPVEMVRRYGQFRRLSMDGSFYAVILRQGAQERVVTDAMGIPVQIDLGEKLRDPRAVLPGRDGLRTMRERNDAMRDRFLEERRRQGMDGPDGGAP